MKVLLDENIHVDFRHHLPRHDVYTVSFLGWKSTRNGALIARAAADGFELLVTIDKNILHQQNVASLPLIIATLYPRTDAIHDVARLAPALLAELAKPQSSKLIEIYP